MAIEIKNPELKRFLKDKISVLALIVLIPKEIYHILPLQMFILLMNSGILQGRILIIGSVSLIKIH